MRKSRRRILPLCAMLAFLPNRVRPSSLATRQHQIKRQDAVRRLYEVVCLCIQHQHAVLGAIPSEKRIWQRFEAQLLHESRDFLQRGMRVLRISSHQPALRDHQRAVSTFRAGQHGRLRGKDHALQPHIILKEVIVQHEAPQVIQRRRRAGSPALRRPFWHHAKGALPRFLHHTAIILAETHLVFARLIAHQRQRLKICLVDQALAGFCPVDELPNLVRCEAAACVSTCASDGFDRFFKAARVATTFGWGGRGVLLMPLMLRSRRGLVNLTPRSSALRS